MSLGTVRLLYDHHWWANRTLLDTAAKLGEAKAAQKIGSQFSEPSLKRMFFHIFGVDGLWLARWQGVSPASVPDEPATLAERGERGVGRVREQKN